jgi:hypothetical protein
VDRSTHRLDLKREHPTLYHASADEVVEVQVPPLTYLMVDGEGDPWVEPSPGPAVEALIAVSHAARQRVRHDGLGPDYVVMPLQGLWWIDEGGDEPVARWTFMVLQPDHVTTAVLAAAANEVRRRRRNPFLDELRVQSMDEGRCAQVLHVGPLKEKGPALERLHAFVDGRGRRRGKHHEIYLSDLHHAEPAKWRTILRQPLG